MILVTSLTSSGRARVCAAALWIALSGLAVLGNATHANGTGTLEERKLPMRFKWHQQNREIGANATSCQPDCRGWIGAVGAITSDTIKAFDEFARGREIAGATIVLDSSGGSVLDAIALGRRWRKFGVSTTVGTTVEVELNGRVRARIMPEAYCESMCAFLLLSGKVRYVPDGARVRVHQIWMGDRADDAKAASYSAQDLMIVERDIGRLAKYTFDMGGNGDLLSLALSVPPWEPLHEMTAAELRTTNLVTVEAFATMSATSGEPDVPSLVKSTQERLIGSKPETDTLVKPTKTAEAVRPTGGAAVATGEPQN